MWRVFWVSVLLLSVANVARGQDEPRPEQLRKMYDDALAQLKQAQDRKNELAADNDKLNAKVADLQKQLDAAKSRVDEVNRAAASYADKTFFLRSHYAAWREFIRRYPKIDAEWRAFIEGDALGPERLRDVFDPEWPLGNAE